MTDSASLYSGLYREQNGNGQMVGVFHGGTRDPSSKLGQANMLCSQARDLTLTVPLCTKGYSNF